MRPCRNPVLAVIVIGIAPGAAEDQFVAQKQFAHADTNSRLETYSAHAEPVDAANRFFQPVGRNGRSCASCHNPSQGWTIAADEVRRRFASTRGFDPLFRPTDGANCDHQIDTSTLEGRRAAYSLLTDRGLIRLALSVPADAEFEVVEVKNPYGCAETGTLSLYRRPLPATNLRALTSVMWDGRGSSARTGTRPITSATNPVDLRQDLAQQAQDASRIHLQIPAPIKGRDEQSIVNLEMGLATAEAFDPAAGALNDGGARGGALALAKEILPAFFVGINDPREGEPHSIKPENAIRLYDNWSSLPYGRVYSEVPATADPQSSRRASIARGQVLFDQKPFDIKDVPGFNDVLNLPSVTGACGTCHDSPNVGNHSVEAFFKIGLDNSRFGLDIKYLPSITLQSKLTHETVITRDPGRALVTGKWRDIGKFKVPILRGLASRAPYFHNGAARSIADLVNFYDTRFQIHLSAQEKEDLIAFLSVL